MIVLLVAALLGAAVQSSSIGKIIGGEECVPHSQPWQAALYFFDIFICGGILINDQWILTAAHCRLSNIQVCLGDHNRKIFEETEQCRYAVKMCPHPEYNAITFDNDIMLLKLNSPVTRNGYVQNITLGTMPVADNTICNTSGWGSITSPEEIFSDVLMCLNITTVPKDDCQLFYDNVTLTNNMLCAGNLLGGKDTCQGDSGGPLICNSVLQGIISWGDPVCGLPNKPGVFTAVHNYIEFINNVIGNEPLEICYVAAH